MPQPTAYKRNYDFTSYQAQYPSQPLPASPVDSELDRIAIASGQMVSRIALLQRDDGALRNQVVTADSLSNTVKALLGSTMNPRGPWVTATPYSKLDLISYNGVTYICTLNHVSGGVFTIDRDAGLWLLFSNPAADEGTSFFQKLSGTGAQTVFALSDDLGVDENAVMVFIDLGAGKGYDIKDPASYTLTGTQITFAVAPPLAANNVYIFAPSLLLGAVGSASAAAQAAATASAASAASAYTSEQNAAQSVIVAGQIVASLQGTSASSILIGTGTKVFATQPGKYFDGQNVRVYSSANVGNYMDGVASYSGTTLTVSVISTGGTGTFSDWVIKVNGDRGAQGIQGVAGNGIYWGGTTGGSGTVMTMTASPVPGGYAPGQRFIGISGVSNTNSGPTMNINAMGALNIRKRGGNGLLNLAVNDLRANTPFDLFYDGTQLILLNPAATAKGADIASAGTVNLNNATGDMVDITGAVPITAFTMNEGLRVWVRFAGVTTIINGASLVLLGGANITTAPGDFALLQGYSTGVVRMVAYVRANGLPLLGTGKFITGIVPSINAIDTANDIDFSAGSCLSDDGTTVINLPAMTKQGDVAWAAGTNAGALDTGAVANGTYHWFAISKDNGLDPDIIESNSLNPILPNLYTKKRRIYSHTRVSAINTQMVAFERAGGGLKIVFSAPVGAGTNSTSAANKITFPDIPVGLICEVMFEIYAGFGTAGNNVRAWHGFAASNSGNYYALFGQTGGGDVNNYVLFTSTTAQIFLYVTGSTNATGYPLIFYDDRVL